MNTYRRVLFVLERAGSDLARTDSFTLAAAFAFYAVTSLVPVLIVAIWIAGIFFGEDAARGAIVRNFSALLGEQATELIQAAILSASQRKSGTLATILGIGALLVTSSGMFVTLRSGLYALWDIKPPPAALSRLISARLASLALVFIVGLVLLISLVLDAGVVAFGDIINSYVAFGTAIIRTANAVITFTLAVVLFGSMYKILTLNKLSLWHSILAAVITAMLFQLGKYLIGIYLGSSGVGSSFGVSGAIIVLLSWIYYSALIVFFGGALAKALSEIDWEAPS